MGLLGERRKSLQRSQFGVTDGKVLGEWELVVISGDSYVGKVYSG